MQRAQDHINLGMAFSMSKRYQDAIVEFNRALEINPQDSGGPFPARDPHANIGQYEEAERHFRVLDVDPMNLNAHCKLGQLYEASRKTTR
jgi:tetratricopeptide (TPR) repeat protein